MIRLNLGSGTDIRPGFINVDRHPLQHPLYLQWDLRQGLPKAFQQVDVIYSSHFFEHLIIQDGIKLMKECHKHLKPGGLFFMELPDFRRCMIAYLENDLSYFDDPAFHQFPGPRLMAHHINSVLHAADEGQVEHLSFIDEEMALFMLKEAGFENARRTEYREGLSSPMPVRRRYSAYFEANKLPRA